MFIIYTDLIFNVKLFKKNINNKYQLNLYKNNLYELYDFCSLHKKWNILYTLIKSKAINIHIYNNIYIASAIESGNIKLTKILLKNSYPNMLSNELGIVGEIVDRNDYKMLKLIIKNGHIPPNAFDNEAICQAFEEKKYKMVKLLFNNDIVQKSLTDKIYNEIIVWYNNRN